MDNQWYESIIYSSDVGTKSVMFIPYLEHPSTRNSMLALISSEMCVIPKFQWTEEQFELLASLDFSEGIDYYIEFYNIPFLIFISNHYHTDMNLQIHATPDNIHLGDNDMVTIYDQNIDIDNGFLIPCPYVIDDPYIVIYEHRLSGMTEDEIRFWYGTVDDVNLWSLVSMNYINKSAQNGNSFPLLTIYPHLLYPSMRPRTDMSMFQTPLSNYYDDISTIPDNKIAVTRYGKGMSQGMYHSGDRPKDICGYFYYSEPASTTYLSYTKSLMSFNKTTAAQQLLLETENMELTDSDQDERDDMATVLKYSQKRLHNHINGVLPPDLMMTRSEYADYTNKSSSDRVLLSDRKVYVGKLLGLYAVEDDLDQSMCTIAALLGYDLVILTDMVGSHQVVTEILDTRNDSFQYLYFLQ